MPGETEPKIREGWHPYSVLYTNDGYDALVSIGLSDGEVIVVHLAAGAVLDIPTTPLIAKVVFGWPALPQPLEEA